MIQECKGCGGVFEVERPAGKRGRLPSYCSVACKSESLRRSWREAGWRRVEARRRKREAGEGGEGVVASGGCGGLGGGGGRAGMDPVTGDRHYSEAEFEFLRAMEAYRRERKRPWPTWCEALSVLVSLGYRKCGCGGGEGVCDGGVVASGDPGGAGGVEGGGVGSGRGAGG